MVLSWAEAAKERVRGHSAKRSGAMRYTQLGAGVPEITFLGRWRSSLVFQYAEEAMPQHRSTSPELRSRRRRRRARTWRQKPAQAQTAPRPWTSAARRTVPCRRHRRPLELLCGDDVGNDSAKLLGIDSAKWVRVFGRSKALHLVENSPQVSSASWRTKCGWPFARRGHFALYVTPPEKATKCRKCWIQGRGKPSE